MKKFILSLVSVLVAVANSSQAFGDTSRSGAEVTIIEGDFSHSRNANGPQDDYYEEEANSRVENSAVKPGPITGNFGSVSKAESKRKLFMEFNAPVIVILLVLSNKDESLSPKQLEFKNALKAESHGAENSLITAFNKNKNLILRELKSDPMSLFALLYSHPKLNRLVWDRDPSVLADAKTAQANLPVAYVNFINNEFAPFVSKLNWALRDHGMSAITSAGGYLRTYDYVKDSAE